MAKGKKTITMKRVLELSNIVLESLPEGSKDVCLLIETLLHETGNYAGYNNTYWMKQGYEEWVAAGKPEGILKSKFYGPEYKRVYFRTSNT
jgi:hypothetical protein